jgi:hypothetical protein
MTPFVGIRHAVGMPDQRRAPRGEPCPSRAVPNRLTLGGSLERVAPDEP